MILDVSVDIGRNIIGHWNVFIEILDSCANVIGEFHVEGAGSLHRRSGLRTHITQSGYKDDDKYCSIAQ